MSSQSDNMAAPALPTHIFFGAKRECKGKRSGKVYSFPLLPPLLNYFLKESYYMRQKLTLEVVSFATE